MASSDVDFDAGGKVSISATMCSLAPIAQLAEADGLKPSKCRFESDWGHYQDLK